jgi:hypothetical protein
MLPPTADDHAHGARHARRVSAHTRFPHARRNLRKSWGAAAVGKETALLALGGRRYLGEAGRDDGRASVNPGLFVMPMISIRKVVVESCRRLVGSSAEARSNVVREHAYQHFMIISSPRGASGRAVRRESGPVSDPVPYCKGGSHRWKSFSRVAPVSMCPSVMSRFASASKAVDLDPPGPRLPPGGRPPARSWRPRRS